MLSTPAEWVALIQALCSFYGILKPELERFLAGFAQEKGLDPVELIRLISEPNVAAVDAAVDAEINVRFPPKSEG